MSTDRAELLNDLVEEFSTDTDVKEVMHYVQFAQWFAIATEASRVNSLTYVPDIPPEAMGLYRRYSAGVATNPFYHKHFAAINAATIMDDIKARSVFASAKYGDKNETAATIVRDHVANRYSALTTVVMLSSGYEKACEFDLKLKTIMRATPEEVKSCKAIV